MSAEVTESWRERGKEGQREERSKTGGEEREAGGTQGRGRAGGRFEEWRCRDECEDKKGEMGYTVCCSVSVSLCMCGCVCVCAVCGCVYVRRRTRYLASPAHAHRSLVSAPCSAITSLPTITASGIKSCFSSSRATPERAEGGSAGKSCCCGADAQPHTANPTVQSENRQRRVSWVAVAQPIVIGGGGTRRQRTARREGQSREREALPTSRCGKARRFLLHGTGFRHGSSPGEWGR